jgi:DNA-binding transcriptional ArsR family regulator
MSPKERAAEAMMKLLDSPFLRALTEPARLQVVKVLLVNGPADIASIAEHVPQDRSVVSRHLKLLEETGIVKATKNGKRRVYALDGGTMVATLERILGQTRSLVSVCCPTDARAR